MTVENANYISELDPTQPVGNTDLVSEGDDHIRLTKKVLKQSFPNVDSTVIISSSSINSVGNNITPGVSELDFNNNSIINVASSNDASAAQPRSYNDSRYILNGGDVNGDLILTNNTNNLSLEKTNGSLTSSFRITNGDKVIIGDTNTPIRIKGTTISIDDNLEIGGGNILDQLYPIGTIYTNGSKTTNPSDPTLLGFGTWSLFGQGRVSVCIDTADGNFNSLGKTGGAKTHRLTTSELPDHVHFFDAAQIGAGGSVRYAPNNALSLFGLPDNTTSSTGGNQPHNNIQPYKVVYRWIRTA